MFLPFDLSFARRDFFKTSNSDFCIGPVSFLLDKYIIPHVYRNVVN